MSNTTFTEESYENVIIELFENMGYDNIFGPDIEPKLFLKIRMLA